MSTSARVVYQVPQTRSGRRTNDESGSSEHENAAIGLSCRYSELGLLVILAGCHKGASQDEQQVREDGAEHGCLNDAELILLEGNNADLEDGDPFQRLSSVSFGAAKVDVQCLQLPRQRCQRSH